MKRNTAFIGILFLFLLMCSSVVASIQLVNPVVNDSENMLRITLVLTDQKGVALDESKLYFSVYKDNAESPVTLEKTTFPYIESDMTEIPYGYSDSQFYDIWSSDGTTTIFHPSSWSGFKKLGAQAIYHDGDKTYKSEIVWSDGTIGTEGDDSGQTGGEPGGEEPSFDESMLISNPSGEKFETVRNSLTFYKLGGTSIYTGEDTGVISNYVKGDDGNLYLLCVTGGNSTNNYLKLEPIGDSKYVAKLPQLVMIEEYDGVKYGYYASRMVRENIEEKPDSIFYLISETEPNELSFTLESDGTLSMDTKDEDVIMGLTYSDGYWTGYGDAMLSDSLVSSRKNVLPEGVELTKWMFEYRWANWSEYGTMKKFLDVAVTDKEIYINNPYNQDSDQWIKGEIDGNKVTFNTRQLLGPDNETNRYLYFRVGNLTLDTQSEYYYYADADKLVMNFDAENRTLTTDDLVSLYISRGYGQRGYNVNYDFPKFTAYTEKVSKLQNPSFTFFAPDDNYDNYGYSYIQVKIPATDVGGNELNTQNLYYSLYVGDDAVPFVFDADTYAKDFTTDVTEIPYNHEGYDVYPASVGSELHTVFFYFSTADVKLGVQSIYYASDGTVYKSDIVYNTSTGIDDVRAGFDKNAPVFNIQGQRVNPENMGKGIYIQNGKKFIKK